MTTRVQLQRRCHGNAVNYHSSPESSTPSTASTVISYRSNHNIKNNNKKKNRYAVEGDEDDDEGVLGDRMECSGKYCKSCSAGMIADCVALCCCPCAVLNLFTLAFVKLPWMVGRKCLRLCKNNNKKNKSQVPNSHSKKSGKKNEKKKKGNNSSDIGSSKRHQMWAEEEEMPTQISWYAVSFDNEEEEEEEEEEDCVSSAERVWLELYQLGHLGFGRVSFTGSSNVQSVVVQGKTSLAT